MSQTHSPGNRDVIRLLVRSRYLILAAIFSTGLWLALPMAVAAADAEATTPSRIVPPQEDLVAGPPAGPWRRLFLDAMVVEQQQGLSRVFHAATKHPGNPVLGPTQSWEKGSGRAGPYLYGTIFWDDGKLRMWYHGWHNGAYHNGYAESTDGLNWVKPNLGLVEIDGSKDNNVFFGINPNQDIDAPWKRQGMCHNPSVIKRPWVKDPNQRYALFCFGQEWHKSRVAFSPDGLHWTFVPETAKQGLFPTGDVTNFFYDPYRDRYVATRKTANRRGRAVGVAVSNDGLEWSLPVPQPVFVADDLDPDATQIYGMPVFAYQGMYLGLPWIYRARWPKPHTNVAGNLGEAERDSPCTMDVQLAWGWDLINWTRPPRREQFIPRGAPAEFDSDMIYTARCPVQVGDELYFYYGGWDGPHNDSSCKASIGLAVLRLDGFCSMRAGDDEGWLISRRELFRVPKVEINALTQDNGYVVAEILDTENRPIPGFTRDDCIAFTGDATGHVLRWKTEQLPEEFLDVDKKLRFFLKNADLYAYLPDQATGPQEVRYVPGENGGTLPNGDQLPVGQRFRTKAPPSRFSIEKEDGLVYLDMHSPGGQGGNATFYKDVEFNDQTDWTLECWVRVADHGNQPSYGLSSFMRPNYGRGTALYLREDAVGIMSSEEYDHQVIKSVPMDTTNGFHWYRLVHEGGPEGTVALFVDGEEKIRLDFTELYVWRGRGLNVSFGPNASNCEGRLLVAAFGYRVGDSKVLLGPVPTREGSGEAN